jgi:hypothetical protein
LQTTHRSLYCHLLCLRRVLDSHRPRRCVLGAPFLAQPCLALTGSLGLLGGAALGGLRFGELLGLALLL